MDARRRTLLALGALTLALSAGLSLTLSRRPPPPPPPVGKVALALAARDLAAGHVLSMEDLYSREFPALPETRNCVHAEQSLEAVGKALKIELKRDSPIYWDDLTAGPP